MSELIQFSISGLSVGLIYALIALSFVIIWKSSDVANLALGELVCLFAWITYAFVVQLELHYALGIILTIVCAVAVGWLIERFALRPLIAQPILSLIAVTLGLAYFLRGVMWFLWPVSVGALPPLFPGEAVRVGGAALGQEYIWAGGIALLLFIALAAFYRYHKMGIAMRATSDDQLAVQACGVPVTSVFSSSWMVACIVAAIGGILMAQIGGISYGLIHSGLGTFSVVILGGLDSFLGAIIAGPIIGLAQNVGGGYLSAYIWKGVSDIIPFVIILIVLFIKPYGLFGEERIERI
ncbi:MAG: branched-chain amino acid ABC transporter permease [Dehalococcoidia bacterium]